MSPLLSQCPRHNTFHVPLPPPPTLCPRERKNAWRQRGMVSLKAGLEEGIRSAEETWLIYHRNTTDTLINEPLHTWTLCVWDVHSINARRTPEYEGRGRAPQFTPLLLLPGATGAKDRRSGGKTGAIKREKQDEEWEVGERWLGERERVEKWKPESSRCMHVTLLVRGPSISTGGSDHLKGCTLNQTRAWKSTIENV